MGFDITAYETVDPTPVPVAPEDDDWGTHVTAWNDPAFEGRAAPLEMRRDEEGRPTIRYKVSGAQQSFRAGSCGGYNRFRGALCRMGHGVAPEVVWTACREQGELIPGPFVGLINFSDCEGVIGAEMCRVLADDFDEYADRVGEYFEGWHRDTYENFRRAFRLAADGGGCVSFH